METFVALYRGDTIGSAKMIAVTRAEDVVAFVVSELLDEVNLPAEECDPVLKALASGRKFALKAIKNEIK